MAARGFLCVAAPCSPALQPVLLLLSAVRSAVNMMELSRSAIHLIAIVCIGGFLGCIYLLKVASELPGTQDRSSFVCAYLGSTHDAPPRLSRMPPLTATK